MTSPFAPAHPNVVRYNCDKLHPNGVWERDVLGIYSIRREERRSWCTAGTFIPTLFFLDSSRREEPYDHFYFFSRRIDRAFL